MCANAPVHNSCAPEVSPQPNCETVAVFLWPANRPFLGCLLRQQLSPFRFCLLARTIAAACTPSLLLGCRHGLHSAGIPPWEQLVLELGLLLLLLRLRLPGAVGQGAGRGVTVNVHDRQRPGKG